MGDAETRGRRAPKSTGLARTLSLSFFPAGATASRQSKQSRRKRITIIAGSTTRAHVSICVSRDAARERKREKESASRARTHAHRVRRTVDGRRETHVRVCVHGRSSRIYASGKRDVRKRGRRRTPPGDAANRAKMSTRKLTGATRRAGSVNCAVHGLKGSRQGREARGARPRHYDRRRCKRGAHTGVTAR